MREPPAGATAIPDRPSSARLGALVVDDDEQVRLLVQAGLERNGFVVWMAPDADTAIDLYRSHRGRIDVVLLDVRMPGRDGPQVLHELRELDPHVPACFMSGDTGAYEPAELVRRGAAVVVEKPFHPNELAEILRRLAVGAAVHPNPRNGGTDCPPPRQP